MTREEYVERLEAQLKMLYEQYGRMLTEMATHQSMRIAPRVLVEKESYEAGQLFEREECAKVCDDAANRIESGKRTNQIDRHVAFVLRDKAAAIRARK